MPSVALKNLGTAWCSAKSTGPAVTAVFGFRAPHRQNGWDEAKCNIPMYLNRTTPLCILLATYSVI